jgi:hypothetical protein
VSMHCTSIESRALNFQILNSYMSSLQPTQSRLLSLLLGGPDSYATL